MTTKEVEQHLYNINKLPQSSKPEFWISVKIITQLVKSMIGSDRPLERAITNRSNYYRKVKV